MTKRKVRRVRAWACPNSLKFIKWVEQGTHQCSRENSFNKVLYLPRIYKFKPKKLDGRSYRDFVPIEITILPKGVK